MSTIAGLVLLHLAAGHRLGSRNLFLLRIHVAPRLPELGYAIDWQAGDATSYVVSMVNPCDAAAFLKLAPATTLVRRRRRVSSQVQAEAFGERVACFDRTRVRRTHARLPHAAL